MWEANIVKHSLFVSNQSTPCNVSREACFDWAEKNSTDAVSLHTVELLSKCSDGTICFSNNDCEGASPCTYDKDETERRQMIEAAPSTLPGSGCWQDRARNRILFNANHDASAAGSTGLDPVCASDFRDSVEEACNKDLRTCWQLSANDECRRLNYKGASRITIGDDDLPKDIQCTDTRWQRSCQLTGKQSVMHHIEWSDPRYGGKGLRRR